MEKETKNVITVNGNSVACQGLDNESKHPINYIKLIENKVATCMYCGREYEKEGSKHS